MRHRLYTDTHRHALHLILSILTVKRSHKILFAPTVIQSPIQPIVMPQLVGNPQSIYKHLAVEYIPLPPRLLITTQLPGQPTDTLLIPPPHLGTKYHLKYILMTHGTYSLFILNLDLPRGIKTRITTSSHYYHKL